MVYKVVIGPVAQRDLAGIHRYIARDNPIAARDFVDRLIAEAHLLEALPNRGGHVKGFPGRRFTIVDRYLIVYRIFEDKREVRVLNFWHTARERRGFRSDYKISG